MSAGGATNISVGVSSRSTPSSAVDREPLVLARARRGRRRPRRSSPRGSARSSCARLSPYSSPCSSIELAVHARDLVHERGRRARPARETATAPLAEHAARRLDTCAHERLGRRSSQRDADRDPGRSIGSTSKPGTSASISSTQPRDVARHRPGVVEARREREHAVERHEPVRRLEAGDPAARGRDADRAARVGAEADVDEPGGDRRRRAAARATRDAAGRGRVRHRAVVGVLRGDAVGELVQVRLAGVRVARAPRAGARPPRSPPARARRTPPTRTSCAPRPCRTDPSPRAGSRRPGSSSVMKMPSSG